MDIFKEEIMPVSVSWKPMDVISKSTQRRASGAVSMDIFA